ncbi:general stress protein [Halobacillus sp. Marseille-Q1614]|uniref:general stress protein n=1 Tax=Halobacillus sp. Marseille-Q1614 TaxID=2709134 RepID=UPI001570A58B|nr:general stress protein [Halobacillus sp. Marseille-Q1614]
MDKRIMGAVFSQVGDTERAIKDLQGHGYGPQDISVFARDRNKVNVLEDETDLHVSTNKGKRGEKVGKGAGIGAASGGILGGLTGLIVGLGILAIPGIGQIAAAGPIVAALSGLGLGAGGGGIVGALVGAGMPEEEAKQYEEHLRAGKIIVMVEADEKHENTIYQTFLSNKTENNSMYPRRKESHVSTHDHTETKPRVSNNEGVGERRSRRSVR